MVQVRLPLIEWREDGVVLWMFGRLSESFTYCPLAGRVNVMAGRKTFEGE